MPGPQPLSVHYGLWTPEQSCPCNIKDSFPHVVQFSQAVHATCNSIGIEGTSRPQMLPACMLSIVVNQQTFLAALHV